MRFSITWLLVGTAYAAVAAAALSTGAWYYADALWALTLLAVVYASAIAMFASGKRRATAATFVLAAICFLLCLTFGSSDSVPTARLLIAFRISVESEPEAAVPTPTSQLLTGSF